MKNLCTVFHIGYTILHCHQIYTRALISHILDNTYYFVLFFILKIKAIFVSVKWTMRFLKYALLSYTMTPTNLSQHKNKHVVRDQVRSLKHTFICNTAYINQSVEDLESKDLDLSSSCPTVCMILENFLNFSEFQLPYLQNENDNSMFFVGL